ncbi:hypothetical protein [Alicyclobacillus shizuokensis]|uniref:hypothetical protein n=1 Tax=Alicyclobacillus shizuokensis TaxID=392014 RepID=UPI0012ED477A|nr:hypothetical protein [Alicyclobacillus shizuokensis]
MNSLESRINTMQDAFNSWQQNKSAILSALPQIDANRVSSLSALVKAEDALAEINTATFNVAAAKGQKLKKVIDDLKQQCIEAAQNATGKIDPRFADEIDNAISEVDSVVADGLKLDYRLRKIQELGQTALDTSNSVFAKELIVPQVWDIGTPVTDTTLNVQGDPGVEFISGDVTVLDEDGNAMLDESGQLITGTIDESGTIMLSAAPGDTCKLYYPVRLHFSDIPDDFLYLFMQMVVAKNSPLMQQILQFEKTLDSIAADIQAMKGQDWTIDHSIMDNYRDIVKESITPKGLTITVQDGIVHTTFSYNDHPLLDHFVLQRWNEDAKTWEPYDGADGIVSK